MNFRAHSRFSRALFSGSLVRGGLRGKGVRAIDVGWRGEPFLGFLLVALFRPSLPTLLGPRLADLERDFQILKARGQEPTDADFKAGDKLLEDIKNSPAHVRQSYQGSPEVPVGNDEGSSP